LAEADFKSFKIIAITQACLKGQNPLENNVENNNLLKYSLSNPKDLNDFYTNSY